MLTDAATFYNTLIAQGMDRDAAAAMADALIMDARTWQAAHAPAPANSEAEQMDLDLAALRSGRRRRAVRLTDADLANMDGAHIGERESRRPWEV